MKPNSFPWNLYWLQWAFKPTEYGSRAISKLQRLGHKRPFEFHLGLLEYFLWALSCQGRSSSAPRSLCWREAASRQASYQSWLSQTSSQILQGTREGSESRSGSLNQGSEHSLRKVSDRQQSRLCGPDSLCHSESTQLVQPESSRG